MTVKLGLVGLGFIGSTIIDYVKEHTKDYDLQAIYDIDEAKIQAVKSEFPKTRIMNSTGDFEDCDVIIEAAVQGVVEEIFDAAIKMKKFFMPMSIGAFITNESLYQKYVALSEEDKRYIILPSGAIGGFDCIEALTLVDILEAKLTTRKPARIFEKHPYVKEKAINLSDSEAVVIFEGNAKDAARTFPKSVNVAARLALSTLVPEDIKVRVVADPSIRSNIHEIYVKSSAGEYKFTFQNRPSPTNPKTSWLAALSAIQRLIALKKQLQ